MSNPQNYVPGDFLIFQVESAYSLLQVLDIQNGEDDAVWHVAAYSGLYFEIEQADEAIKEPGRLTRSIPHAALTDRAFHSTQMSKLANVSLNETELKEYREWANDPNRKISDRSIRLLLGLR